MTDGTRICGGGLSCEAICPAKTDGTECALSLMNFTLLLTGADIADQVGSGLSPEGGEVGVPVFIV